eukprot:TRINITY_DN3904_c0_g1_i5.p2 TRINITY_DN3904_c0_g1~~TRINITY_DN3904_c0_g1_i5.p2  ORF type:complete len:201 (+),score=51.00 TRINITY_DN3904_c0_g1_i5:1004-1606(+)
MKVAEFLCKIKNEGCPRLGILLPPRKEGRDGTFDEVVGFFKDCKSKVTGLVIEEGELWMPCESRLIDKDPLHSGKNSKHRCTAAEPLEISKYREWVQELAPLLKLTAMLVNLASKFGTGFALLSDLGLDPGTKQALGSVFSVNSTMATDGEITTKQGVASDPALVGYRSQLTELEIQMTQGEAVTEVLSSANIAPMLCDR